MHRRILRTVVILCLLLSLTGCGVFTMAGKLGSLFDSKPDESQATEPEEPDETPAPDPTAEPETDGDPDDGGEEVFLSAEELPFVYGTSSVFDTRTWKKLSFGMEEGQRIVSAVSKYGNYYIHAAKDVYDSTSEGEQCFYILDGNGVLTAFTPVDPGEDGFLFDCVPYKGRFYYHTYVTGDYGNQRIFYYDPSGDAFLEDYDIENTYRHLKEDLSLESLIGEGVMHDLSVAGRIYMKNPEDGSVHMFDESGTELGIIDSTIEEHAWNGFCFLDENYLICQINHYDPETYDNTVKTWDIYDVKSGEKIASCDLPVIDRDIRCAAIRDGYLYYSVPELTESGQEDGRSFYREPIDAFTCSMSDSDRIVSVTTRIIGDSAYYGDIGYAMGTRDAAFTVLDGKCCYLDYDPEEDRGNVIWKEISPEPSSGNKGTASGAADRHLGFADFGRTEYFEETVMSPDDEMVCFKGYYEYFYFDEKDEATKKMNNLLSMVYDGIADYGRNAAGYAQEEYDERKDEEDGLEWFSTYSYDWNFNYVRKLGSHYVEVAFSDYDFGGGAHGYPGMRFLLFDLNTGEDLYLSKLYPGKEEEFKELVAKYTVEDWKKDRDYRYYSSYEESDDKEAAEKEMYDSAMNSASLSMLTSFGEDGIIVYYYPYDLGPYAAGFIEIEIPYSELGFDLK